VICMCAILIQGLNKSTARVIHSELIVIAVGISVLETSSCARIATLLANVHRVIPCK
jgi:hypothetical protein